MGISRCKVVTHLEVTEWQEVFAHSLDVSRTFSPSGIFFLSLPLGVLNRDFLQTSMLQYTFYTNS